MTRGTCQLKRKNKTRIGHSTVVWSLCMKARLGWLRVIKFKFPLQPHQKYYIFTVWRTWLFIASHYLTYTFIFRKVGRMYFLDLGVKGLNAKTWTRNSILSLDTFRYVRSMQLSHYKLCTRKIELACTWGEILSRLALSYTSMATKADQQKWRETALMAGHRRNTSLTSIPFVSVPRHGRVTPRDTSSATSIFLVHVCFEKCI